MPLKINVPFSEKDKAKSIGARWNSQQKTWYIPNNIKCFKLFHKWMPIIDFNVIIRNYTYICFNSRKCWKCGSKTPVIAISGKIFDVKDTDTDWESFKQFEFFYNIEYIPEELSNIISKHFPFLKIGYSQTLGSSYWLNHCIKCNAIQGDYYNLEEFNAPFLPTEEIEAIKITLIRVNLTFDVPLKCTVAITCYDDDFNLIERFAKKTTIDQYVHNQSKN